MDEAFIEQVLYYPYAKWELVLVVAEKAPSKNRAFYAPSYVFDNMEELKEQLDELQGQYVKIGLDYYLQVHDGAAEILGYVPHPGGGIDFNGPY